MRWQDFTESAPRLSAVVRERLETPGVVLIGTIRRDGTPRISAVEPLLWLREFWLAMLFGSWKAADLLRDSRLLVHSVVTSREGDSGEVKLRGRAIEVTDEDVQAEFAAEVGRRLGWEPTPGRCHLFRVDIADVTYLRYDSATGDQFVSRWPANREYRRRGDGGTALLAPEPFQDLLPD